MGGNFVYFVAQHAFLSQDVTENEVRCAFIIKSHTRLKETKKPVIQGKNILMHPTTVQFLIILHSNAQLYSSKLKINKIIK